MKDHSEGAVAPENDRLGARAPSPEMGGWLGERGRHRSGDCGDRDQRAFVHASGGKYSRIDRENIGHGGKSGGAGLELATDGCAVVIAFKKTI